MFERNKYLGSNHYQMISITIIWTREQYVHNITIASMLTTTKCGLHNRSMRVQILVTLLRSLSDKYPWER